MLKDLGIIMYVDDHPTMYEEFGWIYKSWIYSGNWRTSDLVVVCHPNAVEKLPKDDPGVTIIIKEPVCAPGTKWQGYPYVNSIACLSGAHTDHLVDKYAYLLRTDADVFLTKNLVNFRSSFPVLGRSHYADHPDVWPNIVAIAEKHGLQHHHIHETGSSLLATSDLVLFFLREQTQACELLHQEFIVSPGTWPGWYHGVITMYASELVANHHYDKFLVYAYRGILDIESYGIGPVDNLVMHIHAIQTHDYFSKIKYREGDYDNIDLNTVNRDTINGYCHWIAATPLDEIKRLCEYPY